MSDLQAITLTDAALAHIESLIAKRAGKGIGLRLSVKSAGCTGLRYVMDIAESFSDEDYVFPAKENISVIIPKTSYDYLKGTEIDFQKEGLNKKVVFNNPNVEDSCGCGESFNVKTDSE